MSKTTFFQKQSWSIIIFGYNEKPVLPGVVEKVQKVLSKISGPSSEIILVDDGSRDGSVEVIRALQKKHKNVRGVFHPKNLGIGMALRSGYFTAKYENVCAVPADGQFNPQEILVFPRIEKGTFVSFFRKRQSGYSLYRRMLSAINRLINQIFLGNNLEDVNWVKIYKLHDLRSLQLELQSSIVESEICAKLIDRGNRYIQCPSIYHPRTSGLARGGGFKTVFRALLEIVKLTGVLKKKNSGTKSVSKMGLPPGTKVI